MAAPPPPPPTPLKPVHHHHLLPSHAIKLCHRRASVRDLNIVIGPQHGFDRSDSTSSLDSNSSSSSYGSMPATPTSETESRSPLYAAASSSSSSKSSLRAPSPVVLGRRRATPSLDQVASAAQGSGSPRRRSSPRYQHVASPKQQQATKNMSPTALAAGGSFLGRLLGKSTAGRSAEKTGARRAVVVAQAGREDDDEFVVVL